MFAFLVATDYMFLGPRSCRVAVGLRTTDTRRGGLVGKLSNTDGGIMSVPMSVPTYIELPIAFVFKV